MVMIDEELEAAKAAQAVISTLSTSALNSNVVAALRSATSVATNAITTFPSEGPLNEARHTVGIALSDLIAALDEGPITEDKIDKAKGAIEAWMNQLLD